MNVSKPVKMTADEFIAWGLQQDSGRYELERGEVIKMAPERVRHLRTKAQVWRLLDDALSAAGVVGEVLTDGASVQIDERTVYEPDALVRLGPPIGDDEVKVTDPTIVVEVLSPSSEHRDSAIKLAGYFTLASVQHYLILDPESARVIHHRKGPDGKVAARSLTGGTLRLDPPGLEVQVAAFFARLNREQDANG